MAHQPINIGGNRPGHFGRHNWVPDYTTAVPAPHDVGGDRHPGVLGPAAGYEVEFNKGRPPMREGLFRPQSSIERPRKPLHFNQANQSGRVPLTPQHDLMSGHKPYTGSRGRQHPLSYHKAFRPRPLTAVSQSTY